MFEMRDEYAASRVRGFGCGFWTIWALATTVGGLLGQAAGQAFLATFLPAEPLTLQLILFAIPAGIVMGAVVGLAQGLVLFRYLGGAGLRDWLLASMLGGVLRMAVIGPMASLLITLMNTGIQVCNFLIPLAIFGALAGAAFGLPQGFVFSRHLRRQVDLDLWAWVLAYAAGGVFFLPFVMLSGLAADGVVAMGGVIPGDRFWQALFAMTINWLVTGIITGLPLRERLRYHVGASNLELHSR